MPKIKVNASQAGCRKPDCPQRFTRTNRHHRRQESLFIAHFARNPKRKKDPKYRTLVRNYEAFREKDIVVICEHHHCEIHLLYDKIIKEDQEQRRRRLYDYTWPQAMSLMKKLAKACDEWMEERTPGVDPDNCHPKKRFPKNRRRRSGRSR